MTFIVSLLKTLGGKIGYVLAFIVAGLTIYATGKKSGQASEKVKAAEEREKINETLAVREINAAKESAKKHVETVKEASNVTYDVNKLEPDSASERLREKWSRD